MSVPGAEEEDLDVDATLDFSALDRRSSGVAHEFGFVTSEDYDSMDPWCVSEGSAAEEKLIRIEWELFLSATSLHRERGFVCV